MNKLALSLIAILALQGAYAAAPTNVTATACTASTGSFVNCAFCDSGNTQSFCTACKPGYAGPTAINPTTSGGSTGPTLCPTACTGNCFYCAGGQQAAAASASLTASATATALAALCQADNQPVTTNVDYTTAICKNVTQTNSTVLYATPSAIQTAATSAVATGSSPVVQGSYSCFTCMQNCINCRPAGGAPTAQSGVTTCQQCFPGYYLSGNTTTGSGSSAITAGTSCNACASAPTITGTTSNSAYIVVGACTQCYNGTSCAVGTCVKYAGTTAGSGTADSTSYKYDLANNKCVAAFAGRLSVAIVGVVAIVFATLF